MEEEIRKTARGSARMERFEEKLAREVESRVTQGARVANTSNLDQDGSKQNSDHTLQNSRVQTILYSNHDMLLEG